jgi:flagellar biosynthesis protein FlhF
MKIKTYIAENVQEAFYKIKNDLGKDAVILQTKYIRRRGLLGLFSKPMVEVIAANELEAPSKSAKDSIKPVLNLPGGSLPYVKENSLENINEIKTGLDEVRNMLKDLYIAQTQQTKRQGKKLPTPLKVFYDRMISMEVDKGLVEKLIDSAHRSLEKEGFTDKTRIARTLKNEIISYIEKTNPISLTDKEQSIIAFVGPTGVGKTTTIAKLAANFALYDKKRVALVTSDTFRVGAIEQLKTYGEILDIPVEVIYSPEDVKGIINRLKGYDFVLIDTMGSSPNNKMQIKKIRGLLDNICPTEIHMVISATTKSKDLEEILNNYRELNYRKIIVTKIDETRSYGLILNAINLTSCALSYITTGQNVPDDIKVATPETIADMILGEIRDV